MAKKYQVSFNIDKCKGCEICVSVCPKNIIAIDAAQVNNKEYHPAFIQPEQMEDCVGCLSCALMCPDVAISIFEET